MVEPSRTERINEGLILELLSEYPDGCVSGEVLSGKLGLAPTAVLRHVEGLRRRGYRIDNLPRRGYRLSAVPDRFTGPELALLTDGLELGHRVHAYEELESTNVRARELARAGAAHGEVVVAEQQTAGKGRRGRSWASPSGVNLYLSLVLRPALEPVRAPELTLVAAVALAEVLEEVGVPATIKWPNDLLVQGAKIAGILTELATIGERIDFVVLGIGVNLNSTLSQLPEELWSVATSVREVRGEPIPRVLFTAALLARLEEWIERYVGEGGAVVTEAWCARSSTIGSRVRVRGEGTELQGIAEGLDLDGALLVRAGDGRLERVLAGDVEELRTLESAPLERPSSEAAGEPSNDAVLGDRARGRDEADE